MKALMPKEYFWKESNLTQRDRRKTAHNIVLVQKLVDLVNLGLIYIFKKKVIYFRLKFSRNFCINA